MNVAFEPTYTWLFLQLGRELFSVSREKEEDVSHVILLRGIVQCVFVSCLCVAVC